MHLNSYFEERMALGCDCKIVLVADAPTEMLTKLCAELWLSIFLFEKRFSRFLPASELSQLNARAGVTTHISDEMSALLITAKDYAQKTNGLFNPFLLPALQRAGYVRSAVPSFTHETTPDYRDRSVVSIEALELSADTVRIPYGTALDLGGIGKGYLLDRLREIVKAKALAGYWISLGGDIIGDGVSENGTPWEVHVQDAQHPDESLDEVLLPSGAFSIATSGTIVHGSDTPGKQWHHIIDPRTLKPARTDVLLATVVAATATEADVYASCCVIEPQKKHAQLLKHTSIKKVLLQKSKTGVLMEAVR